MGAKDSFKLMLMIVLIFSLNILIRFANANKPTHIVLPIKHNVIQKYHPNIDNILINFDTWKH